MKKFLLFSIFTLPLLALSQVNYLEFKERYSLTCVVPDSMVIVKNQEIMDSLHPFEITNGEKEYLYDYAWVYYMRYMKWKKLDDLKIAAETWERGWNEHQDLIALHSLWVYRVLGDCKKSLDYTELYLENVPDSVEVDYKAIYRRYKYCRGKE